MTTFTAPYFINPDSLNWGPKYGYIWTGSCLITALWVFLYFPEVKGRSLEEIDELFEARIPARKFRQYQCRGHAALAAKEGSEREERSVNEKNGAVERVEDIHHTTTKERVFSDPHAVAEEATTNIF